MFPRFSGRTSHRPSRALRAAAVSAFVIGVGACGAVYAAASTDVDPRLLPPVQNYAEQAVPVPGAPPPQQYYDSPLAAGTLTLEDVLEAHKPNPESATLPTPGATPSSTATAPMLTPPPQESSTSLMMSQGMRAVLQKVGDTAVTGPTQMRPPSLNGQPLPPIPQAQGQPASLLQGSTGPAGLAATQPAPGTVPGLTYEPGREPKTLATLSAGAPASTGLAPISSSSSPSPVAVPISESSTAADTSASPTASCDQKTQKWEKSCGDAGYPATFVGKIIGETHSGCADGQLHDVWVSNTCAPPDAASAQSPSTDGACGPASNNQFDDAPASNLCAQGIPSTVSGNGPWTWACSGINGGQAAACTAGTRITPVNAACGPANGATLSSAPVADLCSNGTPTKVRGSGPWTWSCRGEGGGSTQSCIAVIGEAPAAPAVAAAVPVPSTSAAAIAAASEEAPATVEPPAPSDTPEGETAPPPKKHHHKKKPVDETQPVPETAEAPPESAAAMPPVATQAATPEAAASAAIAAAAPSEKGELCGPAAEILAYEAPSHDLCRAGAASAVNGDGPWTWSCTDNEGRSSDCRTLSLSGGESAAPAAAATPPAAPVAAPARHMSHADDDEAAPAAAATAAASEEADTQDLACGAAALQSAPTAPTEELCVNGKPGAVKGSGPWHWTCTAKGRKKITCETPKTIDGRCGPANGTALKSAPFSGLCSVGAPTGIEGNGPWSWTCAGVGGGVSVSCAATVQGEAPSASVDGTCGPVANTTMTSAPTQGLCASGTASAVSGQGPWTWSCSGANGGAVSTCSATKPSASTRAPGPSVNGVCGASNGVTSLTQPIDGLCSTGTATATVGNGPWNWSCLGENGGMTVSCTAPLEPPSPIDGVCGASSGVPTVTRPQSALCASGITGTVSGRGPWTWTCSGANGGSPASCVAPLAGKSAPTPSLTTSANDADAAAALAGAPPPPAGLVTPRLPTSDNAALPSLDRKVVPNLTPSKGLTAPPVPSAVPSAAAVTGDQAPGTAPDIANQQPVQPPAVTGQLTSSADIAEAEAERAGRIPGNHMTLDPTISTILFTRGSGNIDEQVLSTLDRLAGVLQANPDVRITLTAYADNADSTPRDARRLSLTRALAVRDYLASKGVPDSRVDVQAEGANTTSGYIDRVDVKVND